MVMGDKYREGQHTLPVKKKTLKNRDDNVKMMRMKKAESTGMINDNIDKDTVRTEKYLTFYFHSLAKSGTVRIVEEEFNLVTAQLGQVFKCKLGFF